jgi:GTP-binding protein EngB required for normal cell division
MIKVIKQEIDIEESLKKRLEIICDFCNTTPIIINGSIRKIDKTNLSYIEPHKIIIKNSIFLVFNYSNEVYINNLTKKIKISELENYIKSQI